MADWESMRTTLPSPGAQASPWLPMAARIERMWPEVPGVTTYALQFDERQLAETFQFEPGQFNMLYLPGYGEAAISISSDPGQRETLWHTVRAAGTVTQALAALRPGDRIGMRGPFGSAWPMEACRNCDVIVACGGIGLAPLRPALYHMMRHRSEYGRIILLYGARTPHDLLYRHEFDAWRSAGVELEVTVDIADAGWTGHIGVVPTLFYRLRLAAARTRVLTCGPEIMMRFVIFEALARKVAARHIYLSMERNMQCAVGFCGHCQLGPAFVCRDGPIFTYSTMEPYLHLDDL